MNEPTEGVQAIESLFAGTGQASKFLIARTTAKKVLFAETIPANKFLYARMDSANNLSHFFDWQNT